ncbi:MAG: XdhC family protein [Heyndrickxia sp.]
MNDLYRILEQVETHEKEKLALATIIRIQGSSYRKIGAKMLFWENGRRFGSISAGCLEDDLAIHSFEVMKTQSSKRVIYDLQDEEDLTWGVGCLGKIEIFIEPFIFSKSVSTLKKMLFNGKKIITLKPLTNNKNQEIYLFNLEGEQLATAGTKEWDFDPSPNIQTFIHSNEKVKIFTMSGEDFLLEKNNPKNQLYIFGAGPDAEPLARLASSLDFSVMIIDPRESRCNRDFFPTVEKLMIHHPAVFFQQHIMTKSAFVVIMNHHFQRDKQILENLPFERTAYIGILGSKKRAEKLISTLDSSQKKKIHYPIGLNINAEGPDEISVSIMAQIIQVRHQVLNK